MLEDERQQSQLVLGRFGARARSSVMERMRDAAGEGKRHVVNRHSLHHPCAAFVLVQCLAAILMCRPLCVLKYRAEGSCKV